MGLYPDGRPGELFITMAKEGSTIGGLMDCFGTAVSMSLQYGVPLEVYVNKFSHTRFEPMGFTKNPDIQIAKSLVDYIFRWLGDHVPARLSRGEPRAVRRPAESLAGGSGDAETELRPVAMKAGGPTTGPGSAKRERGGDCQRLGQRGDTAAPMGTARMRNGASGNGNGSHAKRAAATAVLAQRVDCRSNARNEQFASFQTDAPSCDRCGAITVRCGNCYLCYNCGNSMGCS